MTDVQIDLAEVRDVARRMLESAGTVAAVRDGSDAAIAGVWRQVVDAGWTGIAIPAEYGGAGATFAELAVVLVELGRALAPGPYLGTSVLATAGLLFAGSARLREEWLPPMAAGNVTVTAALTGPSGRPGPGEDRPQLIRDKGAWVLSGEAAYVPDLPGAAAVIVRAEAASEPALLILPLSGNSGLVVEPTPMFDLSRRFGRLRADRVPVPENAIMARGGDAASAIEAMMAWGSAALACDSLGLAERVLDSTVMYANERVQFNRPIGSFQVVKHRCADMFLAVASTRVAVEDAARQVASDVHSAQVAASLAKAHACDAGASVAGDGVQLHGGIGFTWEHDSHLYLKRAKLNQALLGTSRWHRRRLADHWLQ